MKIFLLILISVAFLYSKASVVLEEGIVLMVNDTKITKNELDRAVKQLFPAQYYHGTISNEKMKVFEKKILDQLLEDELLFQYAKSIGIKIQKSDIDKSIENLKKLLASQNKFDETLKKSEITVEILRDTIYKEEMLKKFNKEKIETTLTQNDLKKYYNENMHKFKEPEKIVAKIIYVKNDPTRPDGRNMAKKRIEEAYKKIKSGEEFANVAAKYSTDMSRIKGGDLGYIHKGMLEPAVEAKAFSMETNTTSEIIEASIGFFIVKVEEKSNANQLSFESVEKILAKDLKKKIEKEKKEKLLERLMSEAVIVR